MYVRGLMTALRGSNKRAMFRLFGDATAFIRVHFLYVAVKTGLVAALPEATSKESLRKILSVARTDLLDSLLDLGLAVGELGLAGDKYYAKGSALRALGSTGGDTLAAFVEAFVTYYNSVYRHFADRLTGAPLDQGLPEIGVIVARASRLIEPYVESFIGKILPAGEVKILDVGCGSAGYLGHCGRINPRAGGVGLEKDGQVAALARENIAHWSLDDRFQIVAADMARWLPETEVGYDLVFFFNLVYYFSPEERVSVFQLLKKHIKKNGRLVIINTFKGRGKDCFAANLEAATCSLEGCWPLPDLVETRRQLESVGFKNMRSARLMPRSTFFGVIADTDR